MKKIIIAGFQHETNTFAPTKASYADFVQGGGFPPLSRGADILKFREQNIPIGGFIQQAEQFGYQLLPVIWAGTSPSAHVEQDAYQRICDEIIASIQQHPADAVYLDLHGAMVSEQVDDGEGELLRRVREAVGPDIPVIASLDFHANVTQAMFAHSDVLICYRTYPHVDMAQTGQRCAQVLDQIFRGKKLHKQMYKLPFLIALNAQCTELEPTQSCMNLLEQLEQNNPVQMNFTPGFPAADFAECGGCIWGYSENAVQLDQAMQRYIAHVLQQETHWNMGFLSPDHAVQQALQLYQQHHSTRPVVIADTQDNPGAGGDSNTTGMLSALHRHQVKNALIGLIVDPAVVQQAYQLELGQHFYAKLGGTSGIAGDAPFSAKFKIKAYSDGKFSYGGPMMHGVEADIGPSVLLEIDGIEIAVSSYKAQLLDRNMFRIFGIVPEDKTIVVVKSSVHFRADFQDMAAAILVAKAPGAMKADPNDLPWQKIDPDRRLVPMGKSLAQRDQPLRRTV
ncbi:M81 family metallopeptidase [Acinetobacter lwoffii]|uniref:Microcystinase C n=1 Tax=Acinetobacter lwoffii TaxID=28090 RepID=A0AAW3VJJ0_ACILW|nr:M81 family metallopeptidase [Acinetobacter lwoffii]MBB6364406.1 microcystin degradation protein MlrC [Acinetobacter lwoffii]